MTFYMADAAFVFNQHNLVSFILRCNEDRFQRLESHKRITLKNSSRPND
jgi:hypothetical protein